MIGKWERKGRKGEEKLQEEEFGLEGMEFNKRREDI